MHCLGLGCGQTPEWTTHRASRRSLLGHFSHMKECYISLHWQTQVHVVQLFAICLARNFFWSSLIWFAQKQHASSLFISCSNPLLVCILRVNQFCRYQRHQLVRVILQLSNFHLWSDNRQHRDSCVVHVMSQAQACYFRLWGQLRFCFAYFPDWFLNSNGHLRRISA